jgi:methionine synthase I (cobalamin-dependent)
MPAGQGAYDDLRARLAAGEVVLLDGGMGTEVEARGVRMDDDAWCVVANLEAPDVVERIHADYITAGADVITTNTFAAGPLALEPAGLADAADRINRAGVEAAARARDSAAAGRPVAIAGSMSGVKAGPEEAPPEADHDRLVAAYRRQARILAEGGADLLLLEMMQAPAEHGLLLEAVRDAGLPVWLGMSAGEAAGGRVPTHSDAGQDFEAALTAFLRSPVDAVLVMHTEIADVDPALEVVRRHWDGPLGAYPHHGDWEDPHWVFRDLAPAALCRRALGWRDRGVGILGGCCGTRPEHIAALRSAL